MDWSDSAAQAQFREEVRKFIRQELPDRYRTRQRGRR